MKAILFTKDGLMSSLEISYKMDYIDVPILEKFDLDRPLRPEKDMMQKRRYQGTAHFRTSTNREIFIYEEV